MLYLSWLVLAWRACSEATGGAFNEADPSCLHCKSWQRARATALQEQAQRSQMIDILSLGTSSRPGDGSDGEGSNSDEGFSEAYEDQDSVNNNSNNNNNDKVCINQENIYIYIMCGYSLNVIVVLATGCRLTVKVIKSQGKVQ